MKNRGKERKARMSHAEKIEKIFQPLIGNATLKGFLTAGASEKTLSHAYIIEGAKGSGKYTLATMLAAALEPDFSDKILSGGCVDVTTYALPEDRKSIGIATIRELKYKTQILPQELSSNIFIVRDAHTMTPEAQNSLLKVLEEPPAGVYIFLLCDTAAALLPTVRSRAPSLRMQIFTEEELSEMLPRLDKKAEELSRKSPDEYTLLIRASGGTIGGAMTKLSQKKDAKAALRGKAENVVGHLRDGNKTDLLMSLSAGNFARDDMLTVLLYLGEAFRDLLAAKKSEEARLIFYLSREQAEEDSYAFATETLMKLYAVVDTMAEELYYNPNMNVFAVRCACALWEATH